MRDAQPRRDHSGRIEREGKVGHHAATDAIASVIYGPPDGQALLIVVSPRSAGSEAYPGDQTESSPVPAGWGLNAHSPVLSAC